MLKKKNAQKGGDEKEEHKIISDSQHSAQAASCGADLSKGREVAELQRQHVHAADVVPPAEVRRVKGAQVP